ncbi:amidase [Xylaria cf. heliscus]|nr:amidase [Xylaria cf. heliscus]
MARILTDSTSRGRSCEVLQTFGRLASRPQYRATSIVATGSPAVIEEEVRMRVNDIEYVLIPHECSFITLDEDTTPFLFLVFTTQPGQILSREALQTFRRDFLDRDDVFQSSFAAHVIFYGSSEQDLKISKDAEEELEDWGTQEWSFVPGRPSQRVPAGPYVYTKKMTWQTWRVYYDVNAAFMCTFKPSLKKSKAGVDGRVIVPSRCYYMKSPSLPLNGLRVAIKDSINIKGQKTTLNNRAWRDFWPPASKTAHCVQLLIDAGAIIVGKVKLQAMIVREEPLEAVEFTDPFNPRGDGYQVPSGSSSGSAAAIASYQWLDLSLGSDTNGSVRKPAHYNGCHTIRPTHGIMNTEGVVGFFPEFDMPGFFGRDISFFPKIMSVWYDKSPMLLTPSEKPVKLLYPEDYLPTPNEAQSSVIDKFVTALEHYLQVERQSVPIAKLWEEHQPDGPQNANISQYLEKAGCYPFFHDSYKAAETFRVGYEKMFGKPPFVHRFEHWLWDLGKSISKEERDECWRRLEVYRLWLLDSVFKSGSEEGITIMVLPIEVGQPNYRDTKAPPPYSLLNGYASLNLSPIMKAPEITAIVGQTTFMSEVTKKPEPYPIAASVLGPPGSDFIITELTIEAMKLAEIPVEVKTGASVY